tara:strand:+ start:98731 stop:99300 length:570 start_codon:yes stop_codon:yes gene_type:complete
MRDGSATRKKLNRCALDLFVVKGVSATTIKDIATKAGIAEGTLYRHYTSKEELATSLFVDSYEKITGELKEIAMSSDKIAEQIKNIVDLMCEHFDDDPVLFRYLLLSQHHQIKYLSNEPNNAHYFFVNILTQAMNSGQVPQGDPHHYASTVMGILLQAAVSRVYKRINRTMKEDATLLTDTVFSALQIK